uniref:Uncharacterized protein n=1 Tax=Molossus molossus TaxID=27622 RepID=A0A7J8EEY4_MOLMO|nr:hypothetical protein HJG59_008921 [Molossus molossus]
MQEQHRVIGDPQPISTSEGQVGHTTEEPGSMAGWTRPPPRRCPGSTGSSWYLTPRWSIMSTCKQPGPETWSPQRQGPRVRRWRRCWWDGGVGMHLRLLGGVDTRHSGSLPEAVRKQRPASGHPSAGLWWGGRPVVGPGLWLCPVFGSRAPGNAGDT